MTSSINPNLTSTPQTTGGAMETIRVIRKYSNRKLYDTATSQYCGLPDVVDWIKAGENIQVVEYDTHRNITNEIILKAIFDREMELAEQLPQRVLVEILQSNATFSSKLLALMGFSASSEAAAATSEAPRAGGTPLDVAV